MFLNAMMLVGISGAMLPLVLHLLSRARHRDVEWGAMMFLQSPSGRRFSSWKLRQYLLLLIRMATVALLAIALARPIILGKMAKASPGGRVTAALLLDCSGSMAYDENGRTRFQMAQAAARQVLRGLQPGDRVSLILMGTTQSDVDLEPTGDLRAVESRIDDAKIIPARANLRDSLSRAADVLDRFDRTNRDIYVICDHQALSWREINDRFRADWQKRLAEPGDGPAGDRATRMFVVPVGSRDADNVAVTDVRVGEMPAIFYRRSDGSPAPIDVEVTIHNYGAAPRVGLPLTVQARDFHSVERKVNVPAGKSTTVTIPVIFANVGAYVVSARIRSAGYIEDDHLEAVVDVIDPVHVLVLSGDERSSPLRSESDFLRFALAPHSAIEPTSHAKASDRDPFNVTVMPAEKWADVDLERYQVVVLANIERFSPSQARAIERYVYGGGQLFIAPGSLSRYDDYNAMLYRDGAGILPAELDAPTPSDGSESTLLLSWDTSHPIFGFLRGQYESPAASIARYFPARPRPVDASAIAWYLTGDPFLIEGKSERGRVLLMTTALDADWSTLPLSNFYLPFVQSTVRYLAGGNSVQSNLAPGQAIHMVLTDSDSPTAITLLRPDGRSEKISAFRLAQQPELRYTDTDLPGEYQVKIEQLGKPSSTRLFMVRPSREESDLSPLSESRWKTLESSLGFQRIDPTARPLREMLASGRGGRELWEPALWCVFALLVTELLIARLSLHPIGRPKIQLEDEPEADLIPGTRTLQKEPVEC